MKYLVLLAGSLLLACDSRCEEETARELILEELNGGAQGCYLTVPLDQPTAECRRLVETSGDFYQVGGSTFTQCGQLVVTIKSVVTESRRATIRYQQELQLDRHMLAACGDLLHLPNLEQNTNGTRRAYLDDSGTWRLEG